MKLALHRSLIFWACLLVMAFLGWAWRDSLTTGRSWKRGINATSQHHAGSARGALYFFRQSWTNDGSIEKIPPPMGSIESQYGPSFSLPRVLTMARSLQSPGPFPRSKAAPFVESAALNEWTARVNPSPFLCR